MPVPQARWRSIFQPARRRGRTEPTGFSGFEIAIGSDFNDTLTGSANADRLEGGLGNDALDGKTGADTMAGGDGDDTYTVDNAGDQVTEAGQGSDLVHSSVTLHPFGNVENLTLTGAAIIDGNGNGLGNAIIGNGGTNTLSGGDGDDSLLAGRGTIPSRVATATIRSTAGLAPTASWAGQVMMCSWFEAAGDKVAEKPNEGTDEIRSSVDYTLKNNVENLTLTGSAVAGTATPSTIWSSATRRANTLFGPRPATTP